MSWPYQSPIAAEALGGLLGRLDGVGGPPGPQPHRAAEAEHHPVAHGSARSIGLVEDLIGHHLGLVEAGLVVADVGVHARAPRTGRPGRRAR